MFGSLGVPELLFIFGLALLIFGPRKLPEIGRTLGRGMAEFRKATNDVKRTINAELIAEEVRESDPRRLMRDSIREVKDGLEKAVRGEDEPAPGQAAADDSSLPGAAVGGVARGTSLDDDDEPTSAAATETEPTTPASPATS
ncbi:MAG: twin-arginine translocase TatA/TatE family subunit [Acidobacteriota bacterium]